MPNRLSHNGFALIRLPLQPLSSVDLEPFTEENARFSEAIFLASAAFHQEYERLGAKPGKEGEKARLSLSKYWLRSCTRCTPYGAFAGVALLNISEERNPRILINKNDRHRLSLRIDMDYLVTIINAISGQEDVRKQLRFGANNSLYRLPDGSYRYASFSREDGARKYELQSLAPSTYLDGILDLAEQPATYATLREWLIRHENVSTEEADMYLRELMEAQVLLPDLEARLTGDDPLQSLVEHMHGLDLPADLAQLRSTLTEVNGRLKNFSSGIPELSVIGEKLGAIPLHQKAPENVFQADMHISCISADIHSGIMDTLLEQLDSLTSYLRPHRNHDLQEFAKRYTARYEEQWMPLSLVLDADLGIGYGAIGYDSAATTSLVEGLPLFSSTASAVFVNDQFTALALRKYTSWLQGQDESIELYDGDLQELKAAKDTAPLPTSMHLMGSLLKNNSVFDGETFLFDCSGFGGPSGGNLLARFAQADPGLCDRLRCLLNKEQEAHPDIIFAEIAHLPQARTGNILLRPLLRTYEIPYVGMSGAAQENQIPVTDLVIRVAEGEVIVWSKKHNKRVIPRLTTAHNYSLQSLPIYKFLCDLQSQGHSYPVIWDWGMLSRQKHLPRVVFKNVILQKARWTVEEHDLGNLPSSDGERLLAVDRWRRANRLPDKVVYKDGDNELLIDFRRDTGKRLFLHYLQRQKRLQLLEALFTEENCIVHDSAGRPYTNEVVIPLTCSPAMSYKATGLHGPLFEREVAARHFPPNSEWQYFKVYCGAKSAETVLINTVLPFVETGLANGLFEHFFLTRFKDESGHLRIRFYNSDRSRQSPLQGAFMNSLQPLIDTGVIEKVMLDTYKRELERYDARIIVDTEQLFHYDSLCTLRLLRLLGEVVDADKYKMLLALRGVDMLLDDFGISEIEEKHRLLQGLQRGFFEEHGASPALQKSLNSKYREHQPYIFSHLDAAKDAVNEIQEAIALFVERSEMIRPIIGRMRTIIPDEWATKLPLLLPSYIHMFMNRVFSAQQRTYELVLYHFLEKYYRSKAAILQKPHNGMIRQPLHKHEQAPI